MSDPEMFIFMKKTLQHFNYPSIHGYSDLQIADIFSNTNRMFLVSWLLKLLGTEYEEALKNKNNSPEFAADVLYESGFCTASQKNGFVNGKLNISEQTVILIRIFKFLMNIKGKEVSSLPINNITNEEISDLIDVDLNIFPSEGELRIYNKKEMQEQIFKLNKEIEETEYKVCDDLQHFDSSNVSLGHYKDKTYDLLNVIRKALPDYKKNILDCLEVKQVHNCNVERDSDCEKIIEQCSIKMKKINEVLSNIKTIVEFSKLKDSNSIDSIRKKREFELMQALYHKTAGIIDVQEIPLL